ncbi:hypothetical protein [Paenibacillus thiaminolyticus]|uniref:Uncharacterized protein n=2 Tax=Paenibacillus thiaminolyticus TaxID=49283 RepID=A0AAP9J2T3_PANTH|nr:hypothetical protein [Paenibacillus thiaminolyticus]MCY9533783.1 hypothetical protein [Paenibacillus thiaminolyticus]MCY9620638.1 hypothetical protein [Paenibacillus thiaminolyticus]MCY9626411.1 hypothetical protein [Paenibacillus thiaminolyticus]MCY9642869.1 hypothetical protein [Paenibacillus thiaminolyticus]MCY9652216.1 hypothetical protein [Paenibacillus thiaminolyticus]
MLYNRELPGLSFSLRGGRPWWGNRRGGIVGIDPLISPLPQSGYAFRIPAVMGLTSSGVINEALQTEPDMEVSAVKTGNLLDDPAVQAVIQEEKKHKEPRG